MENLELADRNHDDGHEMQPRRKQMTTGSRAKRTIPEALRDTFIKGDVHDVVSYVVHDVAIPAAKDTIVSMITNSANMLFKGETCSYGYSGNRYGNGAVGDSRVDYGKPYRQSKSRHDDVPPWSDRSTRNGRMRYVDVEVESKEIAEDILDAIHQDTVEYGMVPVRQLYEMTGLRWTSEDCDYGWSDVSSARILPTRRGMWRIVMPQPEFLEG